MKKLLLYFIFIQIILQSYILGGEIRDSAIALIKTKFNTETQVLSYKLNLSDNLKLKAERYAKQRFFSNYIFYYEVKKNNEIVGYAMLDNVLGKVKPITYLIVFNSTFSVLSVEIIKYREQYGGAVENRDWLEQFNSKNLKSDLELNKDIDGISGATISVKSVIRGVKRLLFLINNLGENEKDLLVSIE